MIRSGRGAVHTFEAFLSAVIIFSTLLYASSFPRDRDRAEESSFDSLGMQALLRLDSEQTLGDAVENRDWDLLERYLRVTLPEGISFNVTIIGEAGDLINDRPISNGGLTGRRIVSVDYLLVVESEGCSLYRVRLQLGR